MIPNRVIIGNRGSGKSISLEVMMTEIAREASLLLIDWPGTLADRMAGRMCEMGLEDRLIVDKARWTDRMPQWSFRPESKAADPLARQAEERSGNEMLLEGLFARRYQKDGSLSPNTYRSALAALAVYFGIDEAVRPPINYMSRLFSIRDDLGAWMLDVTRDQSAASIFRDAARVGIRSPQQWDYLVGAGGRLLDVLSSPAIWPRNGHSLDWQAAIRDRKHFYLGMEGLSQGEATSLAILAYTPAIQAARQLAEATGRAYPLVVILEEAGALGLVTPLIITAMQAYRKYGVSVWVISQAVQDFRDEETFESLLAMSEHYWHQMASGVERAARDCADPTFDPNRVLHTRERTALVGYETVPVVTTQHGASGRTRGTSRSITQRPILGVQIDSDYDNPANHAAECRRQLSTLRVGERFYRGLDGTVCREVVPMPGEPWGPFASEEIIIGSRTRTFATHRLEQVYRRIRSSPLYQPPPVWTHPPSPTPSAPTPIPAPATGREPSGMHGS